ncbi:MAG: CTP synthase [Candidatus Shapirobacteria bacterium]
MKYIFIVGGVVSGLGKGIVASSIGMLLKSSGFKVNMIKIDPYLNVDAGTMRPQEHGETFVTEDGGEIDQDLGNYERFLNQNFSKENNITSGKIYKKIIEDERAFKYEGRDVEMIPDVPNEVKRRFYEMEVGFDFVIVEIGGSTGDIENLPFLYAAREMGRERKAMYVLVSYVPYLKNVGELKTKPTQHAISELRSTGITPDILITRSEIGLDKPRRETLAKRCFLDDDAIFDDADCKSIYEVPLVLEKQGILKKIFKVFKLKKSPSASSGLTKWKKLLIKSDKCLNVALVGKYVNHGQGKHADVYVSVMEALKHGAIANNVEINIESIESCEVNEEILKKFDGIIVPQGWGSRGTEEIIDAVRIARVNKIPYLGLCFGMQMAVIEFARNVLNLKKANSEEVDPKSKYLIVHVMPDQKKYLELHQYGGTIRLGAWPCKLRKNSMLRKIYGVDEVMERHRHRYEVNNLYRKDLEKAGMIISGTSPDGKLVEAIELSKEVHPFFVGTQFHPEYKSRPLSPHPIFVEFVKACGKN